MNKIKKVLVVDDSKLARLTLSRLLDSRNIDVVEADSVRTAFEALEVETIDAIFLDVQMPEQSGLEGLKLLKQDAGLRDIPCSMYSGDLSVEAQQEAIDNGAQAYLFKPANAESLDHVLQALSANMIADDVQHLVEEKTEQATLSSENASSSVITRATTKHRKALLTLDGRTRSLARLFNKEKQETGEAVGQISTQLQAVSKELASLKKQNEYSQHDDLLHKRAENDIRGQLQKTRDNLRLVTTVAFIASVIAIFALILASVIYFNYLQK